MYHALTQKLQQSKLSSSKKSANADKYITKKSSVEWCDHCDKIKTIS